jgi:hypothetical protein
MTVGANQLAFGHLFQDRLTRVQPHSRYVPSLPSFHVIEVHLPGVELVSAVSAWSVFQAIQERGHLGSIVVAMALCPLQALVPPLTPVVGLEVAPLAFEAIRLTSISFLAEFFFSFFLLAP